MLGRQKLLGLLLASEPFDIAAKPELGYANRASLEGLEWLWVFCWYCHNMEKATKLTRSPEQEGPIRGF